MSGSILGFSLPNFWIGLMLILLFAVELRLLPAGGRGPTTTVLGVPMAIFYARGAEAPHPAGGDAGALQVGARHPHRPGRHARGDAAGLHPLRARQGALEPSRIVGVHVLKNIMIPVVTVLGLELGSMIAFAVVTETVFAYPGMGKLLINSINRLDRPIIVAYLMLTVVIFVVINLIVDLLYAADRPARAARRGEGLTHGGLRAQPMASRSPRSCRRSRSRPATTTARACCGATSPSSSKAPAPSSD